MKRSILIKAALALTLLTNYSYVFAQAAESPDHDSLSISEGKQNNTNVPQVLFNGIAVPDDSNNRFWFMSPIFDLLQFNTVEGIVFNPGVSMTQNLKEGKFYTIKPNLRYGFGSEKLYGKVSAIYYYNPSRFGSLALSGGSFVQQFDENSTLTPFTNSYATILLKDNFLKIYESDFLEIGHSFSTVKNLQLTNYVFWSSRSALQNLERFNIENHEYTSNDPSNNEISTTKFERNQVLHQTTEIRWQPGLKYEYQRGKLVATSKDPAVVLKYKSAHSNLLGADLSYQRISLGLEGNIHTGSFGNGNFSFEGGDFISKDSLSFVDFTHFQGNRTSYTSYEPGTFQLLDYYTLSTSRFYFRGHYNHRFGLIKNSIRPVAEINYLSTSNSHYFEVGFGIQKATVPWRVSFYNSWLDGKHDLSEIRFGFVLSDL